MLSKKNTAHYVFNNYYLRVKTFYWISPTVWDVWSLWQVWNVIYVRRKCGQVRRTSPPCCESILFDYRKPWLKLWLMQNIFSYSEGRKSFFAQSFIIKLAPFEYNHSAKSDSWEFYEPALWAPSLIHLKAFFILYNFALWIFVFGRSRVISQPSPNGQNVNCDVTLHTH